MFLRILRGKQRCQQWSFLLVPLNNLTHLKISISSQNLQNHILVCINRYHKLKILQNEMSATFPKCCSKITPLSVNHKS